MLEKLRSGAGTVQLRLPVSSVRLNQSQASTDSPITVSQSPISIRGNNTVTLATNKAETKTDINEGLASRLGTLIPVTNVNNTAIAIRQSEVVNAGLTNTNNKPTTNTLVFTRTAAPAVVTTNATTNDNTNHDTKNDATNNNPTDLIRQLNLARAQGLVVLQQWGDKQVLVHKATGRWIMRQGSRLVTVPPQALGINVTDSSATSSPSGSPAISSKTMEQLAEFDSILESKFKTENNGEIKNANVVVVSGVGNSKQIIQLPTTPLKKELVLGGKDGLKSNNPSPIKSPPPLPNPNATYPKPQEDPETMKRIQAILDDYNDQIRNSPDLHNRPAPRRRTNGSGNPDSPKPDSPRSSGSASGSTSPNTRRCGSESLSPSPSMSPVKSDPLTVAMAEIKESGAITLAAKPNSIPSQSSLSHAQTSTNIRLVPKVSPVVPQRIVVPAGSTVVPAAAAGGSAGALQRLVLVSAADGRRMVAVRPVNMVSANNFTNTINTNM